jgi:hypothetical protein
MVLGSGGRDLAGGAALWRGGDWRRWYRRGNGLPRLFTKDTGKELPETRGARIVGRGLSRPVSRRGRRRRRLQGGEERGRFYGCRAHTLDLFLEPVQTVNEARRSSPRYTCRKFSKFQTKSKTPINPLFGAPMRQEMADRRKDVGTGGYGMPIAFKSTRSLSN